MTDFTNPIPTVGNPFDLSDEDAYRRWRDWKLRHCPEHIEDIAVEVRDLANPGAAERAAIVDACRRANMAVYSSRPQPERTLKPALLDFARQFGLNRIDANPYAEEDGLTALRVAVAGPRQGYVPYTSRAINWHTDGYYNRTDEQVRGLVLHCATPAAEGGESALLDHEMVYLRLRDENPAYISALMDTNAMTVPANVVDGAEVRPARSGPVFSVDRRSRTLHMRYTARARNIVWRDDALTRAAVGFLTHLLAGGERHILRHRLAPGQGLICNNVLHNRSHFTDDPECQDGRLLYRARYLDRVAGTAPPPSTLNER